MREALVILAVMAIIAILTAIRYRRQIAGMIQLWRTLKSVRRQIKEGTGSRTQENAPAVGGPLVNCARCGTWVPQSRAIILRGGIIYCSTNCVESTTGVR